MKVISLLLIMFCVTGCSTVTVESQLKEPWFREENHPVRELYVIIARQDEMDKVEISNLIKDTSRLLEEQVGIRLVETENISINFSSRDDDSMLETLRSRVKGRSYDLSLGFSEPTIAEIRAMKRFGAGWVGVIDNLKRHIILKSQNTTTIAHEICHAFIFNKVHSKEGLMMARAGTLINGVQFANSSYLFAEDRREILGNKWRKFE